jgi:predicted RND superfamily exporter protein
MSIFFHLILKARLAIIIIATVITLVLGFFLKDIEINPDITSYLPKDDPVVSRFDKIGAEYGGNLMALVVIQSENIFTAEQIAYINQLTNEFEILEGVSYVTSLTNILDIRKGEFGIEIGRLVDRYALPTTEGELTTLRDYVLDSDIYRGRIISRDGTASLIICRLIDGIDEVATARQIKHVVEQTKNHENVSFGGAPFMMLDVTNIITKDLMLLIPLVIIVCAVLLFVCFRSFHGVILPLLSVGMSSIWAMGTMALLNIPLTIISNISPVILVSVGSAYSIHVISKFSEYRNGGNPTQRDYSRALADVAIPVMLAAFTTIVGFLSFVLGSYLGMIRDFGIFTSIGIFFAFVISVTFVPSVVSMLPTQRGKYSKGKRGDFFLTRKLHHFLISRKGIVLLVGGIIFLVFLAGIPQIERRADIIDYFKPNTFTRRTETILRSEFGGSMPIYVTVSGDIRDPAVLHEMKRLQSFLESQGDIHNIQSVVTLLETMSDVIGEGKTIPDTKGKVGNLWFLLEGEEIMDQLVNSDKTEAIIQATMESALDNERIGIFVHDLDHYLVESNSSICSFAQTGMPSIYYNLDRSIMRSQITSLIIALVAIFLVLALLLKSFVAALKGMVPICFTLAVIFGFMGFTKMPLDIATVLVGSISIGIGIDYSIHFISRFRLELKKIVSIPTALSTTLKTTGKAIFINALTVSGGFAVLLLANIVPLQRFGTIVTITMVASGFASLVLLPAIFAMTEGARKQKKKEEENETL